MPIVAPVLNGVTLPNVSDYRPARAFLGGSRRTVSGAVQHDVVVSGGKMEFTLTWRGLTDSQRTTVDNAWLAVETANRAFTSPDNVAYTVTRDPNQSRLEWEPTKVAYGVLWATTMRLVEV